MLLMTRAVEPNAITSPMMTIRTAHTLDTEKALRLASMIHGQEGSAGEHVRKETEPTTAAQNKDAPHVDHRRVQPVMGVRL